MNAVAILSATNVGRGTGTSFTFRINAKAAIKSVTVGGATAALRTVPETYANLQRITVTLANSVAAGGSIVLNVSYTLPVESNTGLAAISPMGTQFLPLSFWYPAPNTPFTVRGADTAPVRLVVNGANVISSGIEKSGAAGSTVYEQALFAQPFFVQGDWEKVEGTGDSKNITAFLPRGATAEEKKQAEALVNLAASARTYYAGVLGPAPDVPVRLVSVRRGSGGQRWGHDIDRTRRFTKIQSGFRDGAVDLRSCFSIMDRRANAGARRGRRAVARCAAAVPRDAVY